MTSPQPGLPDHSRSLPPSRALPDETDLQLIAALGRAGGSIPLAAAAHQVGISQTEAATRLIQLAGSGFPLRLLAQGDARSLQQVLNRGPVDPTPAAAPTAVGGPSTDPIPIPGPPEQRPDTGTRASTWGPPGSAAWTRRTDPQR